MGRIESEEFDLSFLYKSHEESDLGVFVMEICGIKGLVPEKFWSVIKENGIDKEKLRQIIKAELEKRKGLE